MAEIIFLAVEDVLQIQEDTIREEGGLPGLRDPKLLESAIMTPMQQFDGSYLHEDIAAMAAAYLFHLAQNHAFHDGNKRVAALCAVIFLHVNGHETPDPVELERVTMAVAGSTMDKGELSAWMRSHIGTHSTR